MPPRHTQSQCHHGTPSHNATTAHPVTMSPRHTQSQCHHGIPSHNVTTAHPVTMSPRHTQSQCHHGTPSHNVTTAHPVTMSPRHTQSDVTRLNCLCCRPVATQHSQSQSHRSTSRNNVIVAHPVTMSPQHTQSQCHRSTASEPQRHNVTVPLQHTSVFMQGCCPTAANMKGQKELPQQATRRTGTSKRNPNLCHGARDNTVLKVRKGNEEREG